MAYQVIPTPKFMSDVEFYVKKRKYTNIEKDIQPIISELEKGNLIGDAITDVVKDSNHRAYKARAVNSNIKVGKSNGYRIIYYAISDEGAIYLLTIYMKADDIRVIQNSEIKAIIEMYCP